MENLSADIEVIDDREFDSWYKGVPQMTPTADDLAGAQQQNIEPARAVVAQTQEEIPSMDEHDTFQPPVTALAQPEAPAQPAAQGGDTPATQPPAEAQPKELTAPEGIAETYKATVDYLIQSGKWVDFEGREGLELNDALFAELTEKQDEYRINQKWEQKVKSLGPYGKAILDYEANGGNPETLLDQFKAQQGAKEYRIDSSDNQKDFIRNYYSELGWTKARVDKHLSLVEMGGAESLKEHAEELKADYDKLYNTRIEQMKQQQESFRQEQVKREQAYSASIHKAISDRTDLTDVDKKHYIDLALNYDQQLPDGRKVNKAYIKFAQIQSDPVLYSRFLEFVDNPEKFARKIEQQGETAASKAVFSFLSSGKAKAASNPLITTQAEPFSFKGKF